MDPFVYNNPADYNSFYGDQSFYGSPGYINRKFYDSSGTNWKDSTAFAYQQMAKYEDNAFNVALMNYENEYNSPYEMMKRYQQAGINPFDVVGKQSQPAASMSPASSGSARSSQAQATANKLRAYADVMSSIVSMVKGASTLQQDLQEIEYRKEAFPLMIQGLNYDNFNKFDRHLLSGNQIENVNLQNLRLASSVLADMYYNGVLPSDFVGVNPYGDFGSPYLAGGIPSRGSMPGFYVSPRGQGHVSTQALRWEEKAYKKASREMQQKMLDQRKREFNARLKYLTDSLAETSRHNRVNETLGGAAMGGGFMASVLRLLFK